MVPVCSQKGGVECFGVESRGRGASNDYNKAEADVQAQKKAEELARLALANREVAQKRKGENKAAVKKTKDAEVEKRKASEDIAKKSKEIRRLEGIM